MIKYCLVTESMSYALGRDANANIVLRESYSDIVDLLNVDQVSSLLFSWGRITLPELEQLQKMGIFTDQKTRRHFLYSAALANKGQEGLDAFLSALCETAGQYEPHALLLDKLRTKLKAHGISPNIVMSKRPAFTGPGDPGSSATTLSVMETSQELPSLTPTDCSDKCTSDITIKDGRQRSESHASTATSGYGTGTNNNTTSSLLERCSHSLCDMISVKLILLGNVGVGKTSLMHRFLNNWCSDSMPTTIAGDRKNCYLHHRGKGVNINLSIWDTGGQERFNCVSPSYYRNIDAVVMVFDMTDNEQRKSLRAVEDWNDQLHLYTSKSNLPVILVGNKCKSPAVNKDIAEHARHMVTELGFNSFMEVSAKEDIGVEELFEKAITLGLEYHSLSKENKNVVKLQDKAPAPQGKCSCRTR